MSRLLILIFISFFLLPCCDNTPPIEDIRPHYLGVWECSEDNLSGMTPSIYDIKISESSHDMRKIEISNLYNFGNNFIVEILIEEKTILTIEQQNIQNFSILGNGYTDNNYENIELNVTLNDGSTDQIQILNLQKK